MATYCYSKIVEVSGDMKRGFVSNIHTSYVSSLAISNEEPEGIVRTGCGREDVIKATQ